MSTALVTGSSGFVGRHFADHLRELGWTVRGIDICNGPQTFVCNALDYFRGAPAVDYDLVVHAAAVVGGREVIDGNPIAQAANLELDAAMFQWAVQRQPGRVIYLSSSAAYPVDLQDTIGRSLDERDLDLSVAAPVRMPDQLYGWTKVTGELLARNARAKGLAVTVVRPFSGYGEDQDDTYPFPAFIDRALARVDPFTIWGDGSQVRDFIHIDDIVAGTMEMYEAQANGPVNLGTGLPLSMTALAGQVCQLAGYAPKIEFSPTSPSGVGYRVAKVHTMRRFWTAKVTIGQGIERALAYRARRSD